MSSNIIRIQRISFLGPTRPPAIVEFSKNVTVVCGASDTGKSFLVDSLNFALGSSTPLRDIPQRIGYDRLRLQLACGEKIATLERSVSGTGFRLAERVVSDSEPLEGSVLKAQHKHGQTDNLSGWLLERIDLLGKRVRRNKDGATNSLSFRNLIDFVLVGEQDIIKERSPFQTGQYTTATSEYATLKLLLSGLDDSALVNTRVAQIEDQRSTAKLEVLDALIRELEHDLEDVSASHEELLEQYERLGNTIESVQVEVDAVRIQADETLSRRRRLQLGRQTRQSRMDEIQDLLSRFDLLAEHYATDIRRLEAIRDSGTLFAYLSDEACPLCGTPSAEQKHRDECDGDVASVVQSANSEIQKITLLSSELAQTRTDLRSEQRALGLEIERTNVEIAKLTKVIDQQLQPALGQQQYSFREIADKRADVSRELELYRRLSRLKEQRVELVAEETPEVEGPNATTDLSKSILMEFASNIERILKTWHFPMRGPVYFDERSRDFVIGGKPRGSFGKGFRAITHAAVTIGLMEFCLGRGLKHPGFIILDSPLLAYWKPESKDDSLEGSDLEDQFFDYLCDSKFPGQAIIIENQHPALSLKGAYQEIDFTRNPVEGRYGLFPIEPKNLSQ